MNWTQIEPATISLRNKLGELTKKAIDSARKEQLEVPPSLEVASSQIERTDYDVVVCGEVKKGKSSFINAVIGDDILPTNTSVATSQVFRITNSEVNKYELVFTDGSRMEISREELSKYGSQVDADIAGEPVFKEKILDYIQVYCPVEFLPKGVSIVDTPGLGALYEAHERITNTYVSKAAAVVFILDPANPIVQQEKHFIQKIYGITEYVLFVMTKRDDYDEQYIVNIVRRDEEILNDAFNHGSGDPITIHAISSKLLSKAGEQSKEILRNSFVKKSHFDHVKEMLLAQIYKAVGISRAQFAYSESDKMIVKTLSLLSDRKKILSSEGRKVYDELSAKRKKLYDDFNSQWGPESQNYLNLSSRLDAIVVGMENGLRAIFTSSNPVYQRISKEIDALDSVDEVNSYGASFLDSFAREISRSWDATVSKAQTEISSVLNAYNSNMDLNITKSIGVFSGLAAKDLSFSETVNCARDSFYKVTFAGIALSVLGVAFAPLSIIGMGLMALFTGRNVKERKIAEAKSRFRNELMNALQKIQTDCCVQPYEDCGYSPLQKIVMDTRENINKAKKQMFERIKSQITSDADALKADMEKDLAQRKEALANLNEQQQEWERLHSDLTQIKTELQTVDAAIAECIRQ